MSQRKIKQFVYFPPNFLMIKYRMSHKKPSMILEYSRTKGGVDNADKLGQRVAYPGIFFWGGGFKKIQLKAERMGIWGQ
jgi:hypothetical protein